MIQCSQYFRALGRWLKYFYRKKNFKNIKGVEHFCVFENLTPRSIINQKACRDVVMPVPPGIIKVFFYKKNFEKFYGES